MTQRFAPAGARLLLAGAAAALLALGGCASMQMPGSPEAIVKGKSLARWEALIKGDFAGAYQFTQPAYRALASVDQYKGRFGAAAQWNDVKVVSVQCEPERCQVVLSVAAYLPTMTAFKEPVTTTVRETWIKEDGSWWFYQRF